VSLQSASGDAKDLELRRQGGHKREAKCLAGNCRRGIMDRARARDVYAPITNAGVWPATRHRRF
jgi:hypothetical protein